MLAALIIISVTATLLALYYRLQLYSMTLRADYWENQVRKDSIIRHQWLQDFQPNSFQAKLKRRAVQP